MTREETLKVLANADRNRDVMQAFAEGKTVEYEIEPGRWVNAGNLLDWTEDPDKYRIQTN